MADRPIDSATIEAVAFLFGSLPSADDTSPTHNTSISTDAAGPTLDDYQEQYNENVHPDMSWLHEPVNQGVGDADQSYLNEFAFLESANHPPPQHQVVAQPNGYALHIDTRSTTTSLNYAAVASYPSLRRTHRVSQITKPKQSTKMEEYRRNHSSQGTVGSLINDAQASLLTPPSSSVNATPIGNIPSSLSMSGLSMYCTDDLQMQYLNLDTLDDSNGNDEYSRLVASAMNALGSNIAVLHDSERGWTMAHYAAWMGSVSSICAIISRFEGAELVEDVLSKALNSKDGKGRTPFIIACHRGYEEVVRVLLGAVSYTIDDTSIPHFDPLRLTIANGHVAILTLLLQHHNQDTYPSEWDSLLHIAISCCLYHPPHLATQLINILITNGSSILQRDSIGSTPLHRACEFGLPLSVITGLLMHPVNNEAAPSSEVLGNGESDDGGGNNGERKESDADRKGPNSLSICMAAISLTDRVYGRTALHWAAATGRIETAKFLINLGAIIEIRDLRGHTPLLVAAVEGHIAMIRFLINEVGAMSAMEDYEGRNIEGLLRQRLTLDL
ncbi:hypothetical protein SmJEL517_g00257 [Synchytrium microbalum]|uniref:Uncharacterized protein n=1 Tax=Synchytrium microbalum TaxID=1806994 RepID=A0A507CA58_9FUNG|nr:uncharacterized protein SmJEL517_g00257 [Synchytrium microbalum]TPX37967.1 hypothetical protein SmJEL517_g00257 [Synchytrium microbalum]